MKQGDITIQDQSVILPANFVGQFSRDVSVATGTQAVTGVGFKPSSVVFFSTLSTFTKAFSVGMDNLSAARGVYNDSLSNYADEANDAIRFEITLNTNYYSGRIQSFDVDGFTISWVKNGSPTGNGNAMFIAFK